MTARAVTHATNCYNIANVQIEGKTCRTNLPSNTAFRGFGSPQAMFIMEQVIDHVAQKLNMEPSKVCLCVLIPSHSVRINIIYSALIFVFSGARN